MENAPVNFSQRKQWIWKSYFLIGLAFCIIIVSVYVFAWSRGATLESILVSGSVVLIFTFLFTGFGYLCSIKLAKRHLAKNSIVEGRTPWDVYTFTFLFVMLACDVFGVVMILVKKMFLAGAIVIILGSLAFYFASKRISETE
jgi:uncharacterized membrane protein